MHWSSRLTISKCNFSTIIATLFYARDKPSIVYGTLVKPHKHIQLQYNSFCRTCVRSFKCVYNSHLHGHMGIFNSAPNTTFAYRKIRRSLSDTLPEKNNARNLDGKFSPYTRTLTCMWLRRAVTRTRADATTPSPRWHCARWPPACVAATVRPPAGTSMRLLFFFVVCRRSECAKCRYIVV